MHGQDLSDTWTPKLVGERLVEAVVWVQHNTGRVSPAGVKAASITFVPSLADHEDEGWGYPERLTDPKPPVRRITPARVTRMLDAIEWPGRYAAKAHPGSVQILSLWLRCKVTRKAFDRAVADYTDISRASAYRMRDRALAAIAIGLTDDGVSNEW